MYREQENAAQALACYCEALWCLADSHDEEMRTLVLTEVDEQAMKLKGRSYTLVLIYFVCHMFSNLNRFLAF